MFDNSRSGATPIDVNHLATTLVLLLSACGGAARSTDNSGNTAGNSSSAGNAAGGTDNLGGSGSGATSFGGHASGGTSATMATCPADAPTQGTACEGELNCSYGDSPNFHCRSLMSCVSGQWQLSQGTCTWQQPSACPVDEPTAGEACEPPNDAPYLNCRYGERAQRDCVCHTCTRFDYCEAGDEPGWTCKDPPTRLGCPEVTPNLGAPCAGPRRGCSYGHWCIDGVTLLCTDAGWTLVETPCPE
jgi:hypothetical protein